jgi:hypothetical protein
MKKLKPWQSVLAGLVFMACAYVGFLMFIWKYFPGHQHCIKGSGLVLQIYATDHDGKYPTHTNGFGDALALIVAEDPTSVRLFVGVDDDGEWLRNAATNHTDVPEDRCTRIYVQGLDDSKFELAVLFDRYAARGGDHGRSPWGEYLREVLMADGSMRTIAVDRWPAFASNQVELLVKEGIPRATAEAYYRPTLDPNAKR